MAGASRAVRREELLARGAYGGQFVWCCVVGEVQKAAADPGGVHGGADAQGSVPSVTGGVDVADDEQGPCRGDGVEGPGSGAGGVAAARRRWSAGPRLWMRVGGVRWYGQGGA
ncbi:MAG: hypothetical protein ACRDQX_05595 [Pseudonocardiaceae bacterium]